MSKSYSYYFPPSPGPVFKISVVLQLLWQQKVETGVITTRALGSLLCAMPLEKVTRRSYNIWSSALRSLSPGRKKKKTDAGKESLPAATRGGWNRSQTPLLSGTPGPQNPTIQTGRAQKRNPPQRGNVFPQKQFPPICIPATNSLPVSDATIQKWPVAFWLERNCSHSSMTVNIYPCTLTPSPLFPEFGMSSPRTCQGLSGFGYCEAFHIGPWLFSSGFGEAIKVYNWTVNMDKYSVAHFYKSLAFIELFCALAVSD